jgi:predicted transcriptional regulator
MKTHWTERSIEDYLFSIGADFIAQLEEKMETEGISQDKLAGLLGVSKGRVSQLLNSPGNITLKNIVKFTRTLSMKVAVVAYDDNDPENKNGPVNSEMFKICWENSGKPRDFWAFENSSRATAATIYINIDESSFDYVPLNPPVYDTVPDYTTGATFGTANVKGTANTEDGVIKKPEQLLAA